MSAYQRYRFPELHDLRRSVEAAIRDEPVGTPRRRRLVALRKQVLTEIARYERLNPVRDEVSAAAWHVDAGYAQPPAKCGTDGGYYRHKRTTFTEPCKACLRAHSQAERKREKRAAAKAFEGQAVA
jgi:hypothetical protein